MKDPKEMLNSIKTVNDNKGKEESFLKEVKTKKIKVEVLEEKENVIKNVEIKNQY